MGLSNLTIKTFNSSGAQSVCRANKADDTKSIESQLIKLLENNEIRYSSKLGRSVEDYHLTSSYIQMINKHIIIKLLIVVSLTTFTGCTTVTITKTLQ